jgi:hypothetical protein
MGKRIEDMTPEERAHGRAAVKRRRFFSDARVN